MLAVKGTSDSIYEESIACRGWTVLVEYMKGPLLVEGGLF